MLKKKILSAVLAAVIAAPSLSAVSFTNKEIVKTSVDTRVKTQADLKDYVDSFDDAFLTQTLLTYNDKTRLEFQKTYAYAKKVADGAELEAEYTTAYHMLKAASDNLYIYTAADLAGLIDKCKPIYTKNNVLNEEDAIYNTEYYEIFAETYLEAVDYKGSDPFEINNLYEELESIYNGLIARELPVVTRADYIALNQQVQAAMMKQNDYDPNRRGYLSGIGNPADNGFYHGSSNLALKWGMLWAENMEEVRSYFTGESRFNSVWISGADNDLVTGTHMRISSYYTAVNLFGAYVYDWNGIYEAVSDRVYLQISNEDIVAYYNFINNAANAVLAFTPDDYDSSSESEVSDLLTQAHDHIVKMMVIATTGSTSGQIMDAKTYLYENSLVHNLYNHINTAIGRIEFDKTDVNNVVYTATNQLYIIYDKETNEFIKAVSSEPDAAVLAEAAKEPGNFGGIGFSEAAYDVFNANDVINLSKYIPLNLETVNYIGTWQGGSSSWYSFNFQTDTLRLAVEDALNVTDADGSGFPENADTLLGSTGYIKNAVDTDEEWGIIYRNLYYALFDTSYNRELPVCTKA